MPFLTATFTVSVTLEPAHKKSSRLLPRRVLCILCTPVSPNRSDFVSHIARAQYVLRLPPPPSIHHLHPLNPILTIRSSSPRDNPLHPRHRLPPSPSRPPTAQPSKPSTSPSRPPPHALDRHADYPPRNPHAHLALRLPDRRHRHHHRVPARRGLGTYTGASKGSTPNLSPWLNTATTFQPRLRLRKIPPRPHYHHHRHHHAHAPTPQRHPRLHHPRRRPLRPRPPDHPARPARAARRTASAATTLRRRHQLVIGKDGDADGAEGAGGRAARFVYDEAAAGEAGSVCCHGSVCGLEERGGGCCTRARRWHSRGI
ncbi:hypothetical protein BJ546DRAFT_130327 [Cryomyces antarcticus]